jgi:hypothetical protein
MLSAFANSLGPKNYLAPASILAMPIPVVTLAKLANQLNPN